MNASNLCLAMMFDVTRQSVAVSVSDSEAMHLRLRWRLLLAFEFCTGFLDAEGTFVVVTDGGGCALLY